MCFLILANSLRIISIDQFNLYFNVLYTFDIFLKQTGDDLSKCTIDVESLSEYDLPWVIFIWTLTGGFFFAICIGPFVFTGKVRTGVFGLKKQCNRLERYRRLGESNY